MHAPGMYRRNVPTGDVDDSLQLRGGAIFKLFASAASHAPFHHRRRNENPPPDYEYQRRDTGADGSARYSTWTAQGDYPSVLSTTSTTPC
eukprot:6285358-Prymnesium_polylepis.1